MTLIQRIGKVLSALMSVLCAVLVLVLEEDSFLFVILLLGVSFTFLGVRSLIYYFTMARYMVDGKGVLWFGVILFDFGVFTLSITQHYGWFIVVYLLGAYAFSGVVDILRALEAKRANAPMWKLNLCSGILNVFFAGAAVFFGLVQGDLRRLCWIYAFGLLNGALVKFISAFRKTAIVYIQ